VTEISAGVKNMGNWLIYLKRVTEISAGVKNMGNGLIISEDSDLN
jgi:hypothetical protein